MSKRFYHIALELGVAPRDFIRELAGAGLSVGNQMVVITDELEGRIREVHTSLRPQPEPVPEVATTLVETAPPPTDTETVATPGVLPVDMVTSVERIQVAPEIVEVKGTVPKTGAPETGVPETGAPETGVPETGVPKTGVPETGVPETGVPETGVPEAAPIAAEAATTDAPAAEDATVDAVPAEAGKADSTQVPAPMEAEPTAHSAVESPSKGETQPTEPSDPAAAERRRKRRMAGDAPKLVDLVPTIDPRAGRLVKDAPRGGIPGVTSPPRTRGGGMDIQNLNPTIPQSDRAPGARRDSHRRSSVPDRFRGKRGKETFHMRRRSRRSRSEVVHVRPTELELEPPVGVKKFAELSGYKAAEIIKVLFKNHGMMVNPNSMLDQETLEILGLEFEIELTFVKTETEEDHLIQRATIEDADEDLLPRPPVVTILGHVDHGKTTLLDKIRETDVAAHEAGGITQHISASQINLPDGRKVTFIDTPGHEAFTEMRARGAMVTDVVILIVAADDGVMPQTIESISHVKAAGVPMVVAITKCDKANAETTRVRQQLTEHDVFVEGYGGDVSAFEVSGITGQGVPDLLDHLALMAEVESERFRANPNRQAAGTVIESENSPQRGVVATVLIQNGTLHRGDAALAGESWGSVRAMFDYLGRPTDAALPGDPIEIIGLDQPPEAGSKLYVMDDTNRARSIAGVRRQRSRERELAAQSKPTTVESLLGAISDGQIQELNVVLKADVKGSLEPIKGLLSRMGTEEVRVKVIHSAVGAVNDSDVILAAASNAWVLGFQVNADERARDRAKMTGVEIRGYRVIYDIEKDVRDALEGKLAPDMKEVVLGHAEILALFQSSRLGTIAGCRVRDGVLRRDASIRVKRGGEVVHDASIASLRREKDEVREVKDGFECGVRLEGWDAYKEGDELEAYTMEEVRRTLD